MKRERILWPLTHGHQHALAAAKTLKQRLSQAPLQEEPLRELKAQVREFWDMELKGHFKAEEDLLAFLSGELSPKDPDVERFLADHRNLQRLVLKGFREELLRFADLLVKHVRFEEEVLFGKVEKALAGKDPARVEGILRAAAPAKACPRLLAPGKA